MVNFSKKDMEKVFAMRTMFMAFNTIKFSGYFFFFIQSIIILQDITKRQDTSVQVLNSIGTTILLLFFFLLFVNSFLKPKPRVIPKSNSFGFNTINRSILLPFASVILTLLYFIQFIINEVGESNDVLYWLNLIATILFLLIIGYYIVLLKFGKSAQ